METANRKFLIDFGMFHMKLIRGSLLLTKKLPASVITIGNFDGVHRGHQKILQTLAEEGNCLGIPKVLITFEPPPIQFFKGEINFPRLMYWREKWAALEQASLDYLVCLYFNHALASLSATEFVYKILLNQLGMRRIIIGDDFRFGLHRQGDVHLLQKIAEKESFQVVQEPPYQLNGLRISSTLIRNLLLEGNIPKGNSLLGRPYYICGKVVKGDQRGATLLGFPTANIDLRNKPVPLSGIFVVTVEGLGKKLLPAVASLGVRPMFDGSNRWLEIHLLDFNEKIYGKRIKINFLQKLRDEECFASVGQLISQIEKDVCETRAFFNTSQCEKIAPLIMKKNENT